MARKLLLTNILLLAGILVCAQQLVSGWRSFQDEHEWGKLIGAGGGAAGPSVQGPIPGLDERLAPYPDYLVIAERHLFREERRPPAPESEGPEVVQAPKLEKKPEMNGLISMRGQTQALVTVFPTAAGPGEPRKVRLGDSVQGYVVSEITPSSLTLKWNDVEVVVDMADARPVQQNPQAAAGQMALNIIRIGSVGPAVETNETGQSGAESGGSAARVQTAGPNGGTNRRNVTGSALQRLLNNRGRGTNQADQPAARSGVVGGANRPARPNDRPPS